MILKEDLLELGILEDNEFLDKYYNLVVKNFSTKKEKSGMIKSTPGVSNVGKDDPQSTSKISWPYIIAVIFFPISPSPPKNATFNAL